MRLTPVALSSFVLLLGKAACDVLSSDKQVPLINPESNDCGIGFDLTPSYGTAAIACPNQPVKPLAKITGNDAYKTTLLQLSHSDFWPPRQYTTYPAPSPPDPKSLTNLANMLISLRKASEKQLGQRVVSVAVTVPHLSKVYDSLIRTAVQAAGMEYLQIIPVWHPGEVLTYHENALLAAHGLFTHNTPGAENYYLIGYYTHGIEAVMTSPTKSPYEITAFPYADLSLGSAAKDKNPNVEYYWEEVRKLISLPMNEVVHRKPTKVVFHGDMVGGEKFRSVVDAVLRRYVAPDELPGWIESGVYAGAMGAAQLARGEKEKEGVSL